MSLLKERAGVTTAVTVVFFVVIIALLGFIGYRSFQANNTDVDLSQQASSTNDQSNELAETNPAKQCNENFSEDAVVASVSSPDGNSTIGYYEVDDDSDYLTGYSQYEGTCYELDTEFADPLLVSEENLYGNDDNESFRAAARIEGGDSANVRLYGAEGQILANDLGVLIDEYLEENNKKENYPHPIQMIQSNIEWVSPAIVRVDINGFVETADGVPAFTVEYNVVDGEVVSATDRDL